MIDVDSIVMKPYDDVRSTVRNTKSCIRRRRIRFIRGPGARELRIPQAALAATPPNRERVLQEIAAQPGITKNELCRSLGLTWGTICHHVRQFQQSGTITQELIQGRRCLALAFHPAHSIRRQVVARDQIQQEILRHLRASGTCGIQELAKKAALSRKTIRRKLLALYQAGLVTKSDGYRPRFSLRVEQTSDDESNPPTAAKSAGNGWMTNIK